MSCGQRAALWLVALALMGCGTQQKRGRKQVPPQLRLEVVDAMLGKPARQITLPTALVPDYQEEDQSAWLVATLFAGEVGDAPARLEVELEVNGKRSAGVVDPYRDTDDLVWIVRWNRKDQLVLDNIDPRNPFPKRHGRGGNRGRRGTAQQGVRGLRLIKTPATSPGAAMQGLTLIIDDRSQTLSLERLAEVSSLDIMGDSGKGARDAWSLRTLAADLATSGARVTSVRGEDGRESEVSQEDWADVTRTPVIRLNRRGKFKFHWADADLHPLEGQELRNITTLVITTQD